MWTSNQNSWMIRSYCKGTVICTFRTLEWTYPMMSPFFLFEALSSFSASFAPHTSLPHSTPWLVLAPRHHLLPHGCRNFCLCHVWSFIWSRFRCLHVLKFKLMAHLLQLVVQWIWNLLQGTLIHQPSRWNLFLNACACDLLAMCPSLSFMFFNYVAVALWKILFFEDLHFLATK